MLEDKHLIAIYSRKSKYTGKGESIENQIEMCKKYIINKYSQEIINNIIIYEDEGFTGANTNRPQFQKMLKDFQKGYYKMLVVYRLDRVSRNVLDFCSLKDLLSNLGIDFVSITENFDTSTPMGSAMLMITSVFAQLERDTIAERIKDNMHELAKTGRWLGGTTPLGFISKKIEFISIDNKKRNLYQLTYHKNDLKKVKLIFNIYKELHSLSKLETYLIENNIKTRSNTYFSRFALANILKNLVYCKADIDIKNFLESKGIEIYSNNLPFDGSHGLISYNKRIQKKTTNGKTRKDEIKDITEWIIAIGKHQGILNGCDWIDVYQTLEKRQYNKRCIKKNSQIESLLSGILRCNNCHSFMRPKLLKTINENNERNFSYVCELKSRSRKKLCHVKNINGQELDKYIINEISKIKVSNKKIGLYLKEIINKKININSQEDESKILETVLINNQKKIKGLLEKLAVVDIEIAKIVNKEIKLLHNNNQIIKNRIKELLNNNKIVKEVDINDISIKILNDYHNHFNYIPLDTRRELIKLLVSSILYDGENIYINLLSTTT